MNMVYLSTYFVPLRPFQKCFHVRVLLSLIKLISKYFIFPGVVKGSFVISDRSLLTQKNTLLLY